MTEKLPRRKKLYHTPPDWVPDSELFFITINGSPRRLNQFAIAPTGNKILEPAKFHHGNNNWYCRLLVLMPDHIHLLVAFPAQTSMTPFITSWKRYLTKTCTVDWQRGFFDHRIREWESLDAKADYIQQNPVRAGLVDDPKNWPWKWDLLGDT